jgi:hypothetical protein
MVNHDADISKALQDLRVKLLDLSKRNRLLNFRNNRFCAKIVDEQPNQVFDYLVRDGKSMIFAPLPEPDEPEHKPFAFNTLFLMSACLSIKRSIDNSAWKRQR